MTDPLPFPDYPTRPIDMPAARGTIDARFESFHRLNPWVYDALVTLTRDLTRRGHDRIGIAMLFEVLRWQYLRTTVGDPFKLNNDYRSRYSRLIMATEPDLADVFETRRMTAPRPLYHALNGTVDSGWDLV
jgi:hypothetical protein